MFKDRTAISKNQIALAGEFAALSQLALRGYDANLTLGNTKSVDILLSHPETESIYRLEVKTHYNNKSYISRDFGFIESHWRMSDKHEKIVDPKLFYCFVSIAKDTQSFDFYVVPSNIVAKFIQESHIYWVSKKDKKMVDTPIRSFMLGRKGEEYKIAMPLAEDYRGRWDLLK